MSKKKLLEFGLKEADAFQKNFKIFLDRLIRGYKSVMNREPEGLDLLKIKMEAREKALNTTKVVNQKGLTLDPDKPIIGGTQEGIETIKTKFDLKETQDAMLRKEMKELDENMKFFQKEIDKAQGLDKSAFDELENFTKKPQDIIQDMVDKKFGKNFFGDELDDVNLTKDDPMGDLEKIVKGEGKTGLPKEGVKPFKYRSPDEFTNRKEYEKYLDEVLGPADDVFGNPTKDQMLENFDKVKAKNVTPGGGVQSALEEELGVKLYGDETFDELMIIKNTGKHPRDMADGGRVGFLKGGPTDDSIIGKDLPTGLGGILGGSTTEDDDMSTKTAGLNVLSGLVNVFGPRLGEFIFQRGKQKVIDAARKKAVDKVKQMEAERVAKEAARRAETQRIQARLDRDPRGTGPGPSSGGPYGGGRGGVHSDYRADGGLITMFVEKR